MSDPATFTPFQRGYIFWEFPQPAYEPPDEGAGRREWLEGFMMAYADYPDGDDFEHGESFDEALARLLAHHPARATLRMMARSL